MAVEINLLQELQAVLAKCWEEQMVKCPQKKLLYCVSNNSPLNFVALPLLNESNCCAVSSLSITTNVTPHKIHHHNYLVCVVVAAAVVWATIAVPSCCCCCTLTLCKKLKSG